MNNSWEIVAALLSLTSWKLIPLLLSIISLLVAVFTTVLALVTYKRHSAERVLLELELKRLRLEMELREDDVKVDAKNLNLKNAEQIVELLIGRY
jgi:hypothetical protein